MYLVPNSINGVGIQLLDLLVLKLFGYWIKVYIKVVSLSKWKRVRSIIVESRRHVSVK